jgi:SPOR domain
VVFPPLNANANPPPVASVATSAPPPITANGTLPNNEPRKVRTLSVKGDTTDSVPSQAQAQAPAPTRSLAAGRPPASRGNPASANASANQPLSLTPGPGSQPEAAPPTRVASTAPTASVSSSGYLVQVSSQRNEADAQASYRALQNKFPGVLGSHSPLIKRADLGEKGVYYRAMVGPFGSPEEASQFCGNLKSAGGQCVVQRN